MKPETRRGFISALKPAALFAATRSLTATARPVKAVVFDAFPIFDPRPAAVLAESLFPARGVELSNLWRIRQFEYTWLRSLSHNYTDFRRVTEDALVFAAKALQLELTAEKRSLLMGAWLKLKCWPDAPAALRALKDSGLRLAFLSNLTPEMLDSGIRNSGLDTLFDYVLSTDSIRVYKPNPEAYRLAVDAFRLRSEEITFVAFAGWDAAGAKTFGYPTFWVNRLNQPAEELGVTPDGMGTTLADLVTYLSANSRRL